jgi:hypothetical protein
VAVRQPPRHAKILRQQRGGERAGGASVTEVDSRHAASCASASLEERCEQRLPRCQRREVRCRARVAVARVDARVAWSRSVGDAFARRSVLLLRLNAVAARR